MVKRAPSTTTIVYVRHGVTPTTGKILPGRAKGLHLSETGRLQAERVAEDLVANTDVHAVYASPLERARETAKPIGAAFGLKVQAHKGFVECDFGDWTGMELKTLNRLPEWKAVLQAPEHFRFPNGESYLAMQTRLRDSIAELVETHPSQTVVVASHADPIKMALCLALGTSIRSMHRMDVAPCSATTVRYGQNGSAFVTRVNHTITPGDRR